MKYLLIITLLLVSNLCNSQHKYFIVHGDTLFLRNADGSDSIQLNRTGISATLQTILDGKQATLVSGTNIKTVNSNSLLGSGDIEITSAVSWGNVTGTLANQTDLNNALAGKLATSGNGSALTGLTASQVGLGNVTNESKATMFTSPTFTGTPIVPGYLPNTTTAGVGSSPTASSTVTVTHNLGRVPAIIRIYGYGTFTSNAAATATTSSIGVFNSSGNFCVYQRFNTAAITTTQAGLSSNTFSILLSTGANSFISGVIQNVTSTTFDIVFTETGTATAQVYLWEAQ